MSGAAEQLNATQSGISQALKRLENDLDIALFERTSRGIRPTPEGEIYYLHCKEMLKAHDAVVGQMRREAGNGQVVVAGMPAWMSGTIAPSVIQRFAESHPGLSVDIMEARPDVLMHHLNSGELSFAVCSGDECGPHSQSLFEDQGVLVARDDGRFGSVLEAGALSDCRLIVPRAGTRHRANIDGWLHDCRVMPAEVMEVSSAMSTLSLILRTDWVTILPGVVALVEADPRELSVSRLAPAPPLPISLVQSKDASTPASRELMSYVRDELQRLWVSSAAVWPRSIEANMPPPDRPEAGTRT